MYSPRPLPIPIMRIRRGGCRGNARHATTFTDCWKLMISQPIIDETIKWTNQKIQENWSTIEGGENDFTYKDL